MFPRQRPRAAIVDLDGTIVNSVDAHARAWVAAFREAGYDVSIDQVRSLLGMSGEQMLTYLLGVPADAEVARRIQSARADIFRSRFLGKVAPFVGARALLERMRRQEIRITVATTNEAREARSILEAGRVADLIDEVVTPEDVRRCGPEWDLVHTAIRYSGAQRDATVLLGDTPFDVEAGRRAGTPVIAFRCGGWGDAALVGATAIYDDPRDLLTHYNASPLYPAALELRPQPASPSASPPQPAPQPARHDAAMRIARAM